MPISNERVPNRPLSGDELVQIIERDVHKILTRDGMFGNNIAFSRVAYEVRVSLHMENPVYPEHISTTLSTPRSKQEIAADPQLAAIETGPLKDPVDPEDEVVFSEEVRREIASPNAARIENEMPLIVEKKNLDTGVVDYKKIQYDGEVPSPASVGNSTKVTSTIADQKKKWEKKR